MCSHDSNEYTQYSISQYKQGNNPNLSQICNYRISSKGPKNEFETAVVNEPSVFEPLKFYYNIYSLYRRVNICGKLSRLCVLENYICCFSDWTKIAPACPVSF